MDYAKVRLAILVISAFNLEYVIFCAYSGVRDDVVNLPAWGK